MQQAINPGAVPQDQAQNDLGAVPIVNTDPTQPQGNRNLTFNPQPVPPNSLTNQEKIKGMFGPVGNQQMI